MKHAKRKALFLIIFFLVGGCADNASLSEFMKPSPLVFKILDEKTGEPIQGAVLIEFFRRYKGPVGLRYGYVAEIEESVSDKDGIMLVPHLSTTPRIKIYKSGYVGWDSRFIYQGCYPGKDFWDYRYERKKVSFEYINQTIYLKPWDDEATDVSHSSHNEFLEMDLPYENTRFEDSIDKYELPLERNERRLHEENQDIFSRGKVE